jgi:hypothetical protein
MKDVQEQRNISKLYTLTTTFPSLTFGFHRAMSICHETREYGNGSAVVLYTLPNTAIAVRAAVIILSTDWCANAAGEGTLPPAAVGNGETSQVSGTKTTRPSSLVASLPHTYALRLPSKK